MYIDQEGRYKTVFVDNLIVYIENPKDSLEKKNKTTTLELSSASLQNTNKKNKNQPYFYSSKHVRNEIKNIIPFTFTPNKIKDR